MGTLEGKAALVTGAASGLGLAIATALAADGASVCVADMNEPAGRAAVEAFERQGCRAMFVRVDVSDAASARAMVGAAVAAFGRLDVLVNNAGLAARRPDCRVSRGALELSPLGPPHRDVPVHEIRAAPHDRRPVGTGD